MYYEKTYTDGFFNVSGDNGFLPIKEPISRLPHKYNELQRIIDNLHVMKNEEEKGILGKPNEIVVQIPNIPNYKDIIETENDIFVLQALYRAYTFITSGFTLELSYQEFINNGNYGQARGLLPAYIAEPLVLVSNKLQAYPWLDYHYAYSLGNYVKKNPDEGLHWKNLDMACKFVGSSDEIGFIMVHVYINEMSPQLVRSVMEYGRASRSGTSVECYVDACDHVFDRKVLYVPQEDIINEHLQECGLVMAEMNKRRRDMWTASRHERYNDFRVFIMGIKGNDKIFPNGLTYENCFNNEPQYYRGQTGAQDSIIPMMDIFTGIVDYYPDNQLTQYLLDLRTYRPVCVQNFFNDLREHYKTNNIFEQLKNDSNYEGLIYLLKIVDEVYLFRNGHWQFVQKYIMSNTKYAFATGGTPITTWLINQIEAVLEFEKVIVMFLQDKDLQNVKNTELWSQLSEGLDRKQKLLIEQVNELKNVNYNIDLIYLKNNELNLEDSKL
jgi:indoleamine 2,3-dioxygenase